MNDLDAFRAALHEPPFDSDPTGPDLPAIMAAGGRIRRRRVATGMAAAFAVVALLVGGWAAIKPGPIAAPVVPAAPGQVGPVLPTGFGDWVFTVEPLDTPGELKVVASRKNGPVVVSNETQGSHTAPGFHAVQGGMNVNGFPAPAFGYYVGPVARIVAEGREGGVLTADQAVWRENDDITVFWFDPAVVGDGYIPRALAAFDSAGAELPTGNSRPGVG